MISDKAKSMSSKEHIAHSMSTGADGEAAFIEVLKGRGLNFVLASESDNKKRHVDVWVGPKGNQVGVDVKGLKSSHKKGYTVVEAKNVQGRDGWCAPSTAAKLIAFQFPDFFLVVQKDLLWDFCKEIFSPLGERHEGKFSVEDVYHKKYTRQGRNDLMTVISLEDLESLQHIKYSYDGEVVSTRGQKGKTQEERYVNDAPVQKGKTFDLTNKSPEL
jgi:Holliday junction resolvase